MKKAAPILTHPGLIPLPDGNLWRLDSPLVVKLGGLETIIVPHGFVTDLASIPPLGKLGGTVMLLGWLLSRWFFWGYALLFVGYLICYASAYLRPYGRYTYAAVVHDYLFQTHHLGFSASNWVLLRLMVAEKTPRWERFLIWFNVQMFGYWIYLHDRRAKV